MRVCVGRGLTREVTMKRLVTYFAEFQNPLKMLYSSCTLQIQEKECLLLDLFFKKPNNMQALMFENPLLQAYCRKFIINENHKN